MSVESWRHECPGYSRNIYTNIHKLAAWTSLPNLRWHRHMQLGHSVNATGPATNHEPVTNSTIYVSICIPCTIYVKSLLVFEGHHASCLIYTGEGDATLRLVHVRLHWHVGKCDEPAFCLEHAGYDTCRWCIVIEMHKLVIKKSIRGITWVLFTGSSTVKAWPHNWHIGEAPNKDSFRL